MATTKTTTGVVAKGNNGDDLFSISVCESCLNSLGEASCDSQQSSKAWATFPIPQVVSVNKSDSEDKKDNKKDEKGDFAEWYGKNITSNDTSDDGSGGGKSSVVESGESDATTWGYVDAGEDNSEDQIVLNKEEEKKKKERSTRDTEKKRKSDKSESEKAADEAAKAVEKSAGKAASTGKDQMAVNLQETFEEER